MQNIALPKKINYQESDQVHEGIITIEPLFPGYGMTLGNSLRRILLSSLPGAAVTGVKIKGANHEFMALPGIKEDVLEIILNLKQLRLKIHGDEEVKLELKAKGKKVVTVKDISKNSQVVIKNPDLVLAHITDENGSLEMEILTQGGRGYKMAEGSKKSNREIGYIEIDSIFSPVILVSISVENTRVGKMTNWDKLILKIKTDGTINTQEAFQEAVKILVNQYSSFLTLDNKKEDPKKEDQLVKEEEVVEASQQLVEEELLGGTEEVQAKTPKKTKKTSQKKAKK